MRTDNLEQCCASRKCVRSGSREVRSGLDYPDTYDYLTNLPQAWLLDLHRIPTDLPLLDLLVASGLWDHTAPTGTAVAGADLHRVLITEPSRRAHA